MATSIIKKNSTGADSGWKTVASYLKYRRIGDVLYIYGIASNEIQIPANGNSTIGTLPVGYRPNEEALFLVGNRGAATPMLYGRISTNGNITIYNGGAVAVGYFIYDAAIPL